MAVLRSAGLVAGGDGGQGGGVHGQARPRERGQFERKGFYVVDPVDSREGRPVFNRTVTLRDTWAKVQGRQ